MGIYANKLKDITKIKDGGEIAIPNDPTNGGRALILLQTAGLIKVDPAKQQLPTVSDITENKRQLKITELDATQTARALQDVDASVINSGMAVDAGYTPDKDAIFLEPVNEKAKPYVNIVVAEKKIKRINFIKSCRRISTRRNEKGHCRNIKRRQCSSLGNIW